MDVCMDRKSVIRPSIRFIDRCTSGRELKRPYGIAGPHRVRTRARVADMGTTACGSHPPSPYCFCTFWPLGLSLLPSRLAFALVTMNRPDAPAAAVRPRAMVSEHVTAD